MAYDGMKKYEQLQASKGRYGDTEIRKIDNQPSHVNVYEAWLVDNYGKEGQNLVKEMGSGTINPETGLKEYAWWMIPAAIAAYGAYNEYQDTGTVTLGGLWDYSLGNQGLGGYLFGDDGSFESQARQITQEGYAGITAGAEHAFGTGGTFDTRKELETDSAMMDSYNLNQGIDTMESKSNMVMGGNQFATNMVRKQNINKQTQVQNQFNIDKQNMALDFRDKVNNLLMGYAQATGEAYSGASNLYDELDEIIDGSV